MSRIFYTTGWDNRLHTVHSIQTPIVYAKPIEEKSYSLIKGFLILSGGYSWDGASGPTYDTKSTIAPSAEHDAFAQMLRDKLLPMRFIRAVNKFFKKRLKQCGMGRRWWDALGKFRNTYWYWGVKLGMKRAVKSKREILSAPA